MKIVIETDRLLLRELTIDDLPDLAAIMQDEETMYAYDGVFSDYETKDWLNRQLVNYDRDGFGLWAVVEKASGKMIGQCGITRQQADSEQLLEIGYLFNRQFWHRGYAIEAAAAFKKFAFEKLGEKEVYSIIRVSNIPSMNVAIRNGMLIRSSFIKHYRGVDMAHFVFSVRSGR